MSLKRGKFSTEEERIMQEQAHSATFEQIGRTINRSPEAVQQYLENKGLVVVATTDEIHDKTRCLLFLHNQPFWPEIDSIFTKEEVAYFENSWYALYKQASEDIVFSENYHIKEWLTLEIKKHRLLRAEKESLEKIAALKKDIEREMQAGIISVELPKLQEELNLREATINGNNKLVESYSKEIRSYTDKLKVDREKRRDVQATNDTWWGYSKKLEDETHRLSESFHAELGRVAAEKAKDKLMQLNQYIDGDLDYPLLSAETMDMIDNQKEEVEE